MALDAGGNDFLPKPVEAQVLFDLLAQHLNLTWQYAESSVLKSVETEPVEAMLVPPTEVLDGLLAVAQQGRFRKVCQQLEDLMAQDQGYLSFASPLVALTKQFNGDELEMMLNQYLQDGDTNA